MEHLSSESISEFKNQGSNSKSVLNMNFVLSGLGIPELTLSGQFANTLLQLNYFSLVFFQLCNLFFHLPLLCYLLKLMA